MTIQFGEFFVLFFARGKVEIHLTVIFSSCLHFHAEKVNFFKPPGFFMRGMWEIFLYQNMSKRIAITLWFRNRLSVSKYSGRCIQETQLVWQNMLSSYEMSVSSFCNLFARKKIIPFHFLFNESDKDKAADAHATYYIFTAFG